MKNQENLEQKKCGESCECKTVNDSKKEEIKLEEKVEQDSAEEDGVEDG